MSEGQVKDRLALVVGNAAYKNAPKLRNAVNDARSISEELTKLGFAVRTEEDLDGEQFQRTIGQFVGEIGNVRAEGHEPVAVLFFAGHGVQVRGENYLLPIDGDIDNEAELKLRTISLNVVMEAMGNSAQTSIFLLDCCRDNPLPPSLGLDEVTRSMKAQNGLATIDVPNGTFVAFATQPDNVAVDGTGRNSPFTQALLENLALPDESISEIMIRVRRSVHQRTRGRQIPWDRSALFQNFAFSLQRAASPEDLNMPSPQALEAQREDEYWALIEPTKNPALLQSFIQQFPKSPRRQLALQRIETLRQRSYINRMVLRAATFLLVVSSIFAAYVGGNLMRFTKNYKGVDISGVDLIGGDIHLAAQSHGHTPLRCKLTCIWRTLWGTPCSAFSYDPEHAICYLKDEVGFYSIPDPTGRQDDPSQSWIMRWSGEDKPRHAKAAGYTILFNRQLVGTPADPEKIRTSPWFERANEAYLKRTKSQIAARRAVNPKASDKIPSIMRNDPRTGRQYWKFRSIPCQKMCADMGEDCKGFSHTPFGHRCELFATVTDIVREANGKHVNVPATITGCKDTTVKACGKGG